MVGRILNRSLKPIPDSGDVERKKGKSHKNLVKLCIVVTVVGLAISASTTLPIKMFNIFNSAKPAKTEVKSWEFDKKDIKAISIATLQSHIRLTRGKY